MRVRLVLVALVGLLALGSGPPTAVASAAGDPLRVLQWALDAIHLDDLLGGSGSAPAAPTGQGVLVAVVDSASSRSWTAARCASERLTRT